MAKIANFGAADSAHTTSADETPAETAPSLALPRIEKTPAKKPGKYDAEAIADLRDRANKGEDLTLEESLHLVHAEVCAMVETETGGWVDRALHLLRALLGEWEGTGDEGTRQRVVDMIDRRAKNKALFPADANFLAHVIHDAAVTFRAHKLDIRKFNIPAIAYRK